MPLVFSKQCTLIFCVGKEKHIIWEVHSFVYIISKGLPDAIIATSVVGETNLTTIFRELDNHNNVMVETAVNDNHIVY